MMEKKPMRSAATKILTVSILCSFLFAGCEWTSSSSGESWSNRYDDMNFSTSSAIVSSSGTSTRNESNQSAFQRLLELTLSVHVLIQANCMAALLQALSKSQRVDIYTLTMAMVCSSGTHRLPETAISTTFPAHGRLL